MQFGWRTLLNTYRQLVATAPNAQHLSRQHHLLQIEQRWQRHASGIGHNRQRRVLVHAQHGAGVLQERVSRLECIRQ